MKARISPTLCAVALFVASTAATAAAQVAQGRYQPPAQTGSSRGSRGVVVKKDTAVTTPGMVMTPGARPVAFRLIPAVVMSDGSIFADFGFGLELVRRPCGNGVVQTTPPKVIAGNGQVISPTPTVQPAPSQTTPSQQNAPSAKQRQPSKAAQVSCFTRDASGRVFATQ